VWRASLITCAEAYLQQAELSLIYTVLRHVVQNVCDASHILSHHTARHLITRSRAAKFQTSTLNVWYLAKHTAGAAWWIMGLVRLISHVRSRSVGEQVAVWPRKGGPPTSWQMKNVIYVIQAPPRAPAQQGQEFLNNRVITLIDTCFLLKPGTEQHKAGISKSSSSVKHTEAWWILVPNQTYQGRSSLSIDCAEAWHRTYI